MDNFSRRLQYACDLAGIAALGKGRQTDIAEKLGVSVEAVRKWLSDESRPNPGRLDDLARLLKVSPGWLATGEGEPRDIKLPQIETSLRDQFAASVLPSLIKSELHEPREAARRAYEYADEMLKARRTATKKKKV